MFIASMIAALALQATPAPATGATAPTPAPVKTEAAKPAPKQVAAPAAKKVCKTQIPTGSNMEIRVCKTQAQWDENAAVAQRSMDNLRGVSSGH